MSLGSGDRFNTGGIQEKMGQSSVGSALIWIPALSGGLDSMALEAPPNSFSDSLLLWSSKDFEDFGGGGEVGEYK